MDWTSPPVFEVFDLRANFGQPQLLGLLAHNHDRCPLAGVLLVTVALSDHRWAAGRRCPPADPVCDGTDYQEDVISEKRTRGVRAREGERRH
jgi:hypothetical protein